MRVFYERNGEDCALYSARELIEEEKKNYAGWVFFPTKEIAKIPVERAAAFEIIGDRRSIGSFLGCENSLYEISEEEWEKIIQRSAEISEEKKKAHDGFREAEEEIEKGREASGYCFNCGSWCYGDCGNFQRESALPIGKKRGDQN